MGRLVLHVCRAMRGRHAPRAIVTARDETPTAPSEELEPATGRPCVTALPSNSQQLENSCSAHFCHLTTFVTAHQFCQFISTAFVNLTTFVNFCQLRAHQLCQQYQPLMSLQMRSLLLLTRPDNFCQP